MIAVKIRKEVKVGILFVVALIVIIWGMMFLKGLQLFKPRKIVYAVYEKVNGLVPANPVLINGLKVGQVKDLYFSKTQPGKIIVELYITSDYPIPRNSVAKIYSSDLMGTKDVEIILGDSKAYLQPGDTLKAITEATLGEEVNRQILPLKIKAENLISSIDTVANILQQVLNKNTRDNLITSVEHVRNTLQNLEHTTYNLDTLVGSEKKHLAGIISNVESISSNLRKNNDKITNILSNFSSVSDSLAKARIPSTILEVHNTVADLDQIIYKINNGEGTVGQLVKNEQLYKEVEKAARDLNLLIEDIKANPKKYVKISVF
ncbi:MAG: MlaD family protein [Bacteroidota bacterium]|nr:MlaD family protein [Bacteroidota bacterium]